MANTYSNLNDLFTAIANSIRSKKNSTETIIADNFPSEIDNLRTGFDYNNQNITAIPDYAFYGCEDLKSVDCYCLTSVGASAFENCKNLNSVVLYDSVETVGENAFKGCTNVIIYCEATIKPETWSENWNPDNCQVVWGFTPIETWDISATDEDDVTAKLYTSVNDEGMYSLVISGSGSMKDYEYTETPDNPRRLHPWNLYDKNITNVVILDNLVNIGKYAFYTCYTLASVTIPDSVAEIGAYAFSYCANLTSVTIPDSVTSIGSSAFSGCSSLESITLPFVGGSKSATRASSSTLFGYIFGTLNYTGGVATEQRYKLSYYTTYYIPSSLKSVTITGGNILYGAFYNCTGLTSVTIPDSVTSIGDQAFYNCTGLTSVTIPDSVTSIDDRAFYNCAMLEEIKFNACQCADLNSSASIFGLAGYSGIGIHVTIGKNVRFIPKYLLASNEYGNAPKINSVVFEEGSVCESIGDWAFYWCTSLTSVTIPDSVTSIGICAFSRCTGLTSVNIPNSINSIGISAFSGCSSLEYTEYDNAYYLGNESNPCLLLVAAKSKSINFCEVNSKTKFIHSYAFDECDSLTSVTIGNSITSIDNYAFYWCTSLISIFYEGTINQWQEINIGSSWISNTPDYTIHCIDGDIAKDGTITYHNV
jgi:hypothetical protein